MSSSLNDRITSLQSQIKELKMAKQDATPLSLELKELKAKLTAEQKANPQASTSNDFQLKVPKGTKDHGPESTLLRKKIFNTLESLFTSYGAASIDTPVFELTEILTGKYGEDSKLIYNLADQGGENCSLRYDLTVPFARYLAMNGIQSMKRYHIAKVYRRDQPVMTKGRMREFYQCDFDIAGTYDAMVPDAEIVSLLCEALTKLDIGDFTVKLNHRKILDGIFELAGVPSEKTRSISSAVDKLDKMSWADVKKEMTVDKGLSEEVADRIGKYVGLKGPGRDVLEKLQSDEALMGVKLAKEGLDDMATLFDYLEIYNVLDKISFDMSLARGLDYYTGIIYEAITEASSSSKKQSVPSVPPQSSITTSVPPSSNSAAPSKSQKNGSDGQEADEESVGVGSIAAGGRYDNLVNMFASSASSSSSSAAAGKKKGAVASDQVPCVGISFGVERIFAILEMKRKREEGQNKGLGAGKGGKETQIYVLALGGGLLKERMGFVKMLRENGIKAEFMYKSKPKPAPQWKAAEDDDIPFVAILAPAELEKGTVRIKKQVGKEANTATEGDEKGEEVEISKVVEYLNTQLGK